MILSQTIDVALQAFETQIASPTRVRQAAQVIETFLDRGVDTAVVQQIQAQRLQETVEYAADRSPFYRALFEQSGVPPKSIRRPDDLRALPFTTADDVRGFRDFICVPDDELAALFTTAGSTGEPKQIYYTLEELERITNFSALALRVRHRGKLHALIALPMRHGLWIGSATAENIMRRAGGLPIPVGAGDPHDTLQWMQRFEPNVVASSPSYMTALTREAEKAAYRPPLDLVMLGGEMLTDEQETEFRDYWRAEIINSYGTTEIGGAQTISLPDCRGFHLNDFHLVTEIVDPQTGEAADEGELVFTTIRREAMPLLRYRSGDRARWVECPDRIPLPAVELLGRLDDMIVAGDANLYGRVIADAVTEVPGAGRHVAIYVDKVDMIDRLTIHVEGDEVAEESVREAIFSAYPEARTSAESGQLMLNVVVGSDLSDQIKALKVVDSRGADSASVSSDAG